MITQPQRLWKGHRSNTTSLEDISTPKLNMIHTEGFSEKFRLEMNQDELNIVLYGFVDKTNILQTVK